MLEFSPIPDFKPRKSTRRDPWTEDEARRVDAMHKPSPCSATAIVVVSRLGLRGRRQRGLSPLETRGGLHLNHRHSSSGGALATLQTTHGFGTRWLRRNGSSPRRQS